jgi:hypothetical protein
VKRQHLLPLIAFLVSLPAAAVAGGQEPPALVGFIDLFTRTSIEGEVTCTGTGSCSETGDSVTNVDDLAFSAGGGAVMVDIGVAFGR